MGALFAVGLLCFGQALAADPTVTLTFGANEDFSSKPSFQTALSSFQTAAPSGGLGWEVVPDHVGIGGDYQAKFLENGASNWWLDWYGDGIYVSYHFFGGGSGLDPFLRAGAGCAGRVFLRGDSGSDPLLSISLFPIVAAGLAIRIDDVRLGAVLNAAPYQSRVPVTDITAYPLGFFQAGVFAGFSI